MENNEHTVEESNNRHVTACIAFMRERMHNLSVSNTSMDEKSNLDDLELFDSYASTCMILRLFGDMAVGYSRVMHVVLRHSVRSIMVAETTHSLEGKRKVPR